MLSSCLFIAALFVHSGDLYQINIVFLIIFGFNDSSPRHYLSVRFWIEDDVYVHEEFQSHKWIIHLTIELNTKHVDWSDYWGVFCIISVMNSWLHLIWNLTFINNEEQTNYGFVVKFIAIIFLFYIDIELWVDSSLFLCMWHWCISHHLTEQFDDEQKCAQKKG